VSAQRNWQLKVQKAGLCIRCGVEPRVTANHCDGCRKLTNLARKARYQAGRS